MWLWWNGRGSLIVRCSGEGEGGGQMLGERVERMERNIRLREERGKMRWRNDGWRGEKMGQGVRGERARKSEFR